jgi:hypothetical protein
MILIAPFQERPYLRYWSLLVVLVLIVRYKFLPFSQAILFGSLVLFLWEANGPLAEYMQDMESCAVKRSMNACKCINTGSCDCVRAAFDSDPLWINYKVAKCQGYSDEQVNPSRLYNAYSVRTCDYGDCSSDCLDKLQQIEEEISGFKCSDADRARYASTPVDADDERFELVTSLGLPWIGWDATLLLGSLFFGYLGYRTLVVKSGRV